MGEARSGETVTTFVDPAAEPLDGYLDPKPMVFCGLFPIDGDDFDEGLAVGAGEEEEHEGGGRSGSIGAFFFWLGRGRRSSKGKGRAKGNHVLNDLKHPL